VLVRVVVLAGAVMDLPAWVTALDLDRRVPDREAAAEPALEVAHDVLGVAQRALFEDDVDAQRRLFGRQGPHVKVVHPDHVVGGGDLAGHIAKVDLGWGAFEQQVHRLAHDAPGAERNQRGDSQR